jgi:hypothetical protein
MPISIVSAIAVTALRTPPAGRHKGLAFVGFGAFGMGSFR